MKKAVMIVFVLLLVGFVVLQFFGIDKTNQPIVPAETLESAVTVPGDVSLILGRSCSDCHTNATRYPWYASVQPFGWLLKGHIDEGRQKLNFSVFNTYAAKRKKQKLEQVCEEVESKEMPLPSYLWIHRDAVLSEADAKALCDWTNQEKEKIAAE